MTNGPLNLSFEAQTIPKAWDKAVCELFVNGSNIECQASASQIVENTRDSNAAISINDPYDDGTVKNRISRGDTFGLASLKSNYLNEFISGSIDDRIGKIELIEGKEVTPVPYTYHHRLRKYFNTDQVKNAINLLKKSPNTRRCVMITWDPTKDIYSSDPPCLQQIAYKIINDQLLTYVLFRSNDLFKAWEANMYVITELSKQIADALGVNVGPLYYHGYSLHIYETDIHPPTEPNVLSVLFTKAKKGDLEEKYIIPVIKQAVNYYKDPAMYESIKSKYSSLSKNIDEVIKTL